MNYQLNTHPIEVHTFPNFGFIKTLAPEVLRDSLNSEIQRIIDGRATKIDVREALAGVISQEYEILESRQVIYETMLELASAYDAEFPILINSQSISKKPELYLGPVWVNFQNKYEYNPVHSHSGILSFVIWVSIPFDMDKEKEMYPKGNASNEVASFNFYYTTSLGNVAAHTLRVDSQWNWAMVIFPSSLRHAVHPFFSSDEVRISVAGNLYFS